MHSNRLAQITMKIRRAILVALALWLAGCSSTSDEAYRRLLDLADVKNLTDMQRVAFIKMSGMDPCYLAKIEIPSLGFSGASDVFESPGDWEKISAGYVSAPIDIAWWRPAELRDATIWTKKKNQSPSYTEVIVGHSPTGPILYIAWVKHSSF